MNGENLNFINMFIVSADNNQPRKDFMAEVDCFIKHYLSGQLLQEK